MGGMGVWNIECVMECSFTVWSIEILNVSWNRV